MAKLLSDQEVGLHLPVLMSDEQMGLTPPSVGEDIVRSIPRFAETGVASTLGLPGGMIQGTRAIGEALGIGDPSNNARIEGPAEVRQDLQKSFGYGPLYQPQGAAAQGIDTGISLGASMIGGPESAFIKGVTRVGLPALGITAIERSSSIPQEAKPWLEGAAILMAPWAANKTIGSTLNQIRRGSLARAATRTPSDLDAFIPGRAPGAPLPNLQQMQATTKALKNIHALEKDPALKAQAKAAWDEMSNRTQQMQVIDTALGGAGRARYMTASAIREKLLKLNEDVGQKSLLSAEQQAQLEKIAKGSVGMRATDTLGSPLSLHSGHGMKAAIIAYLATYVPHDIKHLFYGGTATTIAAAARAAYPHFTKNQINKLVSMVQQGRRVPGAPTYSPLPSELNFSPMTPGVALQPIADQENQ